MVTFAEVVETVKHLSEEEINELSEIISKKKERELIEAVEEGRKESKDGKTIVLSSPEEIKTFFEKIAKDAD